MTRVFLALSLIVASTPAYAISCREFLLRVNQVALEVQGRQLMQEGVPIEWQLLAIDYPEDDRLASVWLEREDRNRQLPIRELGLTVEYWGPSLRTIRFIQSVPQWKTLSNGELRAQILLDHLIANWPLYKNANVDYVANELKSIHAADIARWTQSFPNRPIPVELLALR